MEIRINGEPLDFQLDHERTLLDIVGALFSWLANQGGCLRSLKVNGQWIDMTRAAWLRDMDIDDVASLHVSIDTWDAEALGVLESTRRYLHRGLQHMLTTEDPFGPEFDDLLEGLGWISDGLSSATSRARLDPHEVVVHTQTLDSLIQGLAGLRKLAGDYRHDPSRLRPLVDKALIPNLEQLLGAIFALSRDALWAKDLQEGRAPQPDELKPWIASTLIATVDEAVGAASALQAGHDGKAFRRMEGLTSVLRRVLGMMTWLPETSETQQAHAQTLGQTLQDMESALRDDDVVLLADLMDYELSEQIRTLAESFQADPQPAQL